MSVTVDRECGAEPTSESSEDTSPEDGEAATEDAEPVESVTAEQAPMTVDTDPEFASILTLTDYCSAEIAAFAAAHSGATIEFDASIGSILPHGDYATRYDILISAGPYSETSSPGPAFQFRDVNTTSDLNYVNPDAQDTIGVGDNLHVVAEIVRYEESSCLFLLEPVSTEFQVP